MLQTETVLYTTPAPPTHSNESNMRGYTIRQINNIDFLSEVSTLHQFVYTDEALLLVR